MWYMLLFIIFFLYGLFTFYYVSKSLPKGVSATKAQYKVSSRKIEFLYDLSWYNRKNKLKSELGILEKLINNIKKAQDLIFFDVFLFNKHKVDYSKHIKITDLIAKELKKKKQIPVFFITDPLNTSYNTDLCKPLEDLKKIGVKVIFTDLKKLPDNNLVYSGFWRLFLQWLGTKNTKFFPKLFPNPQKKDTKTTLRALLMAANGKANHRKLIVTDNKTIVISSNFHDSSTYYCNTGIEIEDARVANHFLKAEKAVAKMSSNPINFSQIKVSKKESSSRDALVTPLMDGQIKKEILKDIDGMTKNSKIMVASLFLADREIINCLKKSAQRGVKVLLILDNNQVSFDHDKSGLPHNFIVPELRRNNMEVRFFRSTGNEFHTKLIYLKNQEKAIIHAGSANFTRRSLIGSNLENNVRVETPVDSKPAKEVEAYIKRIKDPLYSKRIKKTPPFYFLGNLWVRFAEITGLATWRWLKR